jgi:prepilin-type N-terminal cleavage/methylation domain-containing protein
MLHKKAQSGFTLIELVFVIVLIGILGVAAANRIDSVIVWRQKSDIRKFLSTWEFLYTEALARGNGYRLVMNLDNNTYYVRREVPITRTNVTDVDYLSNLRTKGEQARRALEEEEEIQTLDEEFEEEDLREGLPLDVLFYQSLYADPHGSLRLAQPLEFPSLAKKTTLTNGLRFHKVSTRRGTDTEGQPFIRFSPRGASDYAVVYFTTEDEHIFTAFMNPATGAISIKEGEHEYEWTPQGSRL